MSDVSVSGITLLNSPFWTFSARAAKRLHISNVNVSTTGCGYDEAPNTDGFNVQGEDIVIEHSTVRNGDDCVPIFPPTRNVTVRNMTCECGNGMVPCIWPAFSIPGEGGDIKDVVFDGARFTRTSMAVAIKARDAFVGTASNITFKNFVLDNVGQAVMINAYGQNQGAFRSLRMPSASNVVIEKVRGTCKSPGKIECGPGNASCTKIVMDDVNVAGAGNNAGYQCQNAAGSATNCNPVPCSWSPPL